MNNSKAKYHFYGNEVVRVKNLLSNEPFGKQAEKRKKEVIDLEGKVIKQTRLCDCLIRIL